MQFCNFCAKNSEQIRQIYNHEVKLVNIELKIYKLLNIFQNDIVQFLLDNKETLICQNCLKQLVKSYKFVLKLKESQKKLILGEEIKTEHDYFENGRNDEGNEMVNKKVTVNSERNDKHMEVTEITSNHKFKTILPKSDLTEVKGKSLKKTLENKTRYYKCLQCNESFKSFKHLREHEKEFCENQNAKDLKICQYCHKCFCNQKALIDHNGVKHVGKEFSCCLCQDKLFTAKGYLTRHLEKVHFQQSLAYFCGECKELITFGTQDELRKHFLEKHPTDATQSTLEENSSAALNDDDMDLEMHEEFLDEFLLAHTNENSFQFSECWEALDLHLPDMLQSAAGQLNQISDFCQAFSCPKCFEQFKNPQPLLKHLAEIHDMPVLICRVCQKCFASFKDFKKHKLQKCHNNSKLDSVTLKCPYCSKSCKNSSSLKQHLRIVHCQLKRHICQLCDKQFATLDHLKKHVLSQHQNERKHVCVVCDKSFTQLGHLKQHLAIHTTGKTVQCTECSLKFWRKIDLERHRVKKHVAGI